MMKAFNFRLYPTIDQSNQLNQHIGSCRFVYNWVRKVGIRSVMITGDNPMTAAAIAAEAGIDDSSARPNPRQSLKPSESTRRKVTWWP